MQPLPRSSPVSPQSLYHDTVSGSHVRQTGAEPTTAPDELAEDDDVRPPCDILLERTILEKRLASKVRGTDISV